VHFVELYADQSARLAREGTEFRMAMKRHKRNAEGSRDLLRVLDEQHKMNTDDGLAWSDLMPGEERLRIDNTHLSAADVAARIVEAFSFPAEPPH